MAANPLGGRPPCPRCGRHELSALKTEALRATWAEEEGVRWSWRRCTDGHLAPLWALCDLCHKKEWPKDLRGNRYSRPGPAYYETASSGRVVPLHFTTPPPELLPEQTGPLPDTRPRPRRERSRTPPARSTLAVEKRRVVCLDIVTSLCHMVIYCDSSAVSQRNVQNL